MPHSANRSRARRALYVLVVAALVPLAAASIAYGQAEVTTNQLDYYPGDVVVVTGSGFWPGESVSLRLVQYPTLHDPLVFYAKADSTGAFQNSDYTVQDEDLATSFDLTVTGLSSGLVATTFFTDSPKVGSVTVTPLSSLLCSNTGGSATYTITVNRGSGGGSSGSFTANLSITSALPPGVTASFSPNPVSFTSSQDTRTATLTLSASGAVAAGTTGFTVRAATSANDFATGTEVVSVNAAPTITPPAAITRNNAPGQCGATVTFAATATGSPAPVVSYSPASGSIFPVGTTTVTATATNSCGSGSATFTVTVVDTEKPAITVADLTRSTDPGACAATIATLEASASDNCPGVTLAGTRSDAAPLSAAFPKGVTTITWVATDAHGNTASAAQQVTVNDTENPEVTAPAGLNPSTGPGASVCGVSVSDATLGSATASDNCAVSVERTGVPAGNFFPVGTTTITYTATDPSGNTAVATQTVTVADDTAPSITTGSLAFDSDAGSCAAAVASLQTTADDNCGVSSLVGTRSDAAALNDPYPVGSTTITWVATDIHGNTSSATQTVKVADHENPVVATADITTSNDPGVCAATVDPNTTAADNCGLASLVGTRGDGLALTDPFPKGTTTISWLATDVHGNTSSATQSIAVNDTEKPTISAPASFTLETGPDATQCGLVVLSVGDAAAQDNCEVTVERSGVPAGNFFPVGATTITHTARDASGNTASATHTVTIVDTTPPTITASNLSLETDPGSCEANVASLGTTAGDNCGVNDLTGTRSDGAALAAAFPKGTTTITWVATDIHGNTSSATQTVTVTDDENPTISVSNLSLTTDAGSCTASIASLGATAADNCAVSSFVGTRGDGRTLSDPFPQGSTTITWLATDTSGNTAGATQYVMVADTEHPTLTAPAPLNLTTGPGSQTCGVGVGNAALGTPVAHDNCAVDVTVTGIPVGNLFPVGTTTITYTAKDPSGNTTVATQTVTVVDDTPPSISGGESTHSTDHGSCGATLTGITPAATDNCGMQSVTGVRSDGLGLSDAFPVGLTTITWTATDVHGNTATAASKIHVEDHEAPSIAAPAAVQAVTGPGARICGAVITDAALGQPVATDNCSVVMTRSGVPADHLFPVGTTTITWTATDPSGNASSATQVVTVADDTPPTLSVPAALSLGTGPTATTCGLVVPDAMLGSASATDNCSVTLTRTGVPAGNAFPKGTTTITYTAVDPSGNRVSATQLVTISDTTPPRVTAADITRGTDAGICGAAIASLGASATDNCGTPTLTGVRSDSRPLTDPYPKGVTTILWTATDGSGITAAVTQTITIQNAAPAAAITAPVSGFVLPVGTPVTLAGSFTDEAGDVHTATWTCDALTCPASVNEDARTVSGSMTFAAPGVYLLKLTVTDGCGQSSTATAVSGLDAMVVVYDPSAGFVTGGGWIQSPAGSYPTNPSLTGRANFGFVSKYKKGMTVPTGETEFQFKAGDLNFHSATYDWLVISGARAQYKGTGTINGAGTYGFLLSSIDGQMPGGGGSDKFRIKITDRASGETVYDNMMGAPDSAAASTVLGGGSIQIQTQGGKSGSFDATADAAMPAVSGLAQNRPNPFNPETTLRFAVARSGHASLRIFNARGALVRTLVDGTMEPGTHEVRWNGIDQHGGRVPSGVYYALFQAPDGARNRIRMVLIK